MTVRAYNSVLQLSLADFNVPIAWVGSIRLPPEAAVGPIQVILQIANARRMVGSGSPEEEMPLNLRSFENPQKLLRTGFLGGVEQLFRSIDGDQDLRFVGDVISTQSAGKFGERAREILCSRGVAPLPVGSTIQLRLSR
jgi:hypothetical protein